MIAKLTCLQFIVSLLALSPIVHAQDDKSSVFDKEGLSLSANTYVLNGEKDILRDQREFARIDKALQRLDQDIQKTENEIKTVDQKRKPISDWFRREGTRKRTPEGWRAHQRQSNIMRNKMEKLDVEKAKLKERVKSKQEEIAKKRVSSFETVNAWVERAAVLMQRYDKLAKVRKVADAIAETGKADGKTYQLGPSRTFLAALKELSKSIAKKPYYSSGLNRHQKYPNDATVMINGKEMRQAPIVDVPGPITFSTTHAEKFGFTPDKDAPTLDFTTDNGKVVKAWKVKLKSFRIGEWSFPGLEVLVLPENKGRVKLWPIIRMGLLRHYTYDISPWERRNIAITGLRLGKDRKYVRSEETGGPTRQDSDGKEKPTEAGNLENEANKKLQMAKLYRQNNLMAKARKAIAEILRDYPGTSAAKKAKSMLEELDRDD